MSDLLGGGLMPRHQLAEKDMLLAYLERQRELVVWKCTGLDDVAARSQATPTGLTIHGIVRHLTGVERGWFREHFAGEPEERVRDEEFAAHDDALADLLAAYRVEWLRCDEVIAGHHLDDVAVRRDHSLRWIVVHLIEETSRHLGHLDLLCELADGRTGEEPDTAPPPGVDG
ncbi:MAG TPA: DinB family protein [Mycobacteriales bacterium]|nr:DinB family protein [Mycobacteriales bacterium]